MNPLLSITTIAIIFVMPTACSAYPADTMRNLVKITDGQKQHLKEVCRDSELYSTLTSKPSALLFNQDEKDCISSISTASYFGVGFRPNPFDGQKIHARLLFVCNGSDHIYWINMATLKNNLDIKCNNAYTILKMEDDFIESVEVVGKSASKSLPNQPVQMALTDNSNKVEVDEKTCFHFPEKIISNTKDMLHMNYTWSLCRENTVELDITSQINPGGCNIFLYKKHIVSAVELEYRVYLGLSEKTFNAKALQLATEWYVDPSQPKCINRESKTTAVTLSEPEIEVQNSGWTTTATIIISIGGGVSAGLLIVLGIWGVRQYYQKSQTRNPHNVQAEAQEASSHAGLIPQSRQFTPRLSRLTWWRRVSSNDRLDNNLNRAQ